MEDEAEQRLTNSDQAAIDTEQETVIYGVQTPSVDLEDSDQCLVVRAKHHHHCRKFVWPVIKVAASIVAHVGFLVSLCVVIYFKHKQLNSTAFQDTYRNYALVSGLTAVLFYVVIAVEAAVSDIYLSIRCHSQSQTAEQYIDHMIDARPLIRWRAECYSLPRNGMKLSSYSRGRNKVITSTETEAFHFKKWRDISRDVRGLFQHSVARLECSKVFIFKDEVSKAKYMEEYTAFRDRNRRRDEFMEHEEEFHIPGFQYHVTANVKGHSQPWWSRELCFWLSTSLLMTWLFRWLYRRHTSKVYVIFIKELEV